MTEAITRCPKCKTSFRINKEHLNTARGAVRCGSCLNIFNAREHLIKDAHQAAAKPAPKTEADTRPSPQPKTTEDDDNLLISDDMPGDSDREDTDSGEAFDENIFVAKQAAKSDINLFERKLKDFDEDESNNKDDDESWALDLLDDENEAERAKDLADEKKVRKPAPEEEEYKYASTFQIIDKEKTERPLEHIFAKRQTPEYINDDSDEGDDYLEEGDDYLEEAVEEQREYPAQEQEAIYEDVRNNDFIDAIEAEPLELHVISDNPFWHSKYFWFALSVLAAFIAIAQLAYFQFNDWGRKEPYRAYYSVICKQLGCQLPVLQNLKKIRIDNMTVMDHPNREAYLLVDAVILNSANFDQYFPTLQLRFTDARGALVTQHEFRPADYVGGELAGRTLMPHQHPIHISLEIDDPGLNAVNYQISVVKP